MQSTVCKCYVTESDTPPEQRYETVLKAGDGAPAFFFTLSDSTEFMSPRDFIMWRSTEVVFFSTTCPDCREALARLQSRPDHSNVLCISRAEPASEVAAYWEAHGLTLTYAAVPDRSVYNLFARSGIPRLYIISPTATILTASLTL